MVAAFSPNTENRAFFFTFSIKNCQILFEVICLLTTETKMWWLFLTFSNTLQEHLLHIFDCYHHKNDCSVILQSLRPTQVLIITNKFFFSLRVFLFEAKIFQPKNQWNTINIRLLRLFYLDAKLFFLHFPLSFQF